MAPPGKAGWPGVQAQGIAPLDEQQVRAVGSVAEQDEHRGLPAAGGGRGELRVYLHRRGRARQLAQPLRGGRGWSRLAAGDHENGPVLTSLAATTGSVGPSPNEGQSRAIAHAPQAGRREWQTRRPCQISRCDSDRPLRAREQRRHLVLDLLRIGLVVQPNRRASRPKCVSTVSPGTPKAFPSTTFAVLRPTPGSVTRSSSRGGTSPPNRVAERLAQADQAVRLGAEEPSRLDDLLEFLAVGGRVVGRGRVPREQRRSHHVDALVGASARTGSSRRAVRAGS